jgi:hypothetical protein
LLLLLDEQDVDDVQVGGGGLESEADRVCTRTDGGDLPGGCRGDLGAGGDGAACDPARVKTVTFSPARASKAAVPTTAGESAGAGATVRLPLTATRRPPTTSEDAVNVTATPGLNLGR